MNTSNFSSAKAPLNDTFSIHVNSSSTLTSSPSISHLVTGIKSIDQLVYRYSINFSCNESQLADNAFQKSLILYGQDQRLDYVNLPPCMYMIISQADVDEKFTVHRFYLPYKNGVRFATYLLNEDGEVIESVSYQRNVKYLNAFKIIRKKIVLANQANETLAA
jgi:hypothetical protein